MKISKLWWYIGTMVMILSFFSSAMSKYDYNNSYPIIIQFLRDNSVVLKLLLLIISIIIMLFFLLRGISLYIPNVLIYLFPFKLFVLIKFFVYGQISYGLAEFVFFIGAISLFVAFEKFGNIRRMINLVTWTILALNMVILSTRLIDSFIGLRFVGMSGNPNHLGVFLSMLFFLRLLYVNTEMFSLPNILLIVFMLLTGSRTAMLMTGLVMFYRMVTRYQEVRKFLALILLAAVFAFSGTLDNLEIFNFVDRIKESSNRAGSWNTAFNAFLNSPFTGASMASGKVGVVENSYLALMGNFGLIGVSLFSLPYIFIIYFNIKSLINRPIASKSNLISVISLSTLIGAFFEGFLLSITTFAMFYIIFLHKDILGNTLLNIKGNSSSDAAKSI